MSFHLACSLLISLHSSNLHSASRTPEMSPPPEAFPAYSSLPSRSGIGLGLGALLRSLCSQVGVTQKILNSCMDQSDGLWSWSCSRDMEVPGRQPFTLQLKGLVKHVGPRGGKWTQNCPHSLATIPASGHQLVGPCPTWVSTYKSFLV